MAYNPNYFLPNAKAPSRAIVTGYQNGTVSTIAKTVPVSADSSGKLTITDVTSETSVNAFVGITQSSIPSSANGSVVSGGRLEDVTTSLNIGDPVYLGLSGTLISTKPDYGVAGFAIGDFVVFLGVVVKNEFDNTKKDIQLMIETIGQL